MHSERTDVMMNFCFGDKHFESCHTIYVYRHTHTHTGTYAHMLRHSGLVFWCMQLELS